MNTHASCMKYRSCAQDISTPLLHDLCHTWHLTVHLSGLGKTTPDPSASITLEGVEVPLGTGIPSGVNDTCLLYNEYIVYDIAQVNLKYLLKLKFNFKTSLW